MRHEESHRIGHLGWLRAAVLGANDGMISTASLLVGIAAAHASHENMLLTGFASLVAGSMSMATGEYVSVASQADTEKAAIKQETAELAHDGEAEHRELTAIYMQRGLDQALAAQVATQLMAHDALGAHTRDELGIHEATQARPLQAALASALSFAVGAAVPLAITALTRADLLIAVLVVATLVGLAALGRLPREPAVRQPCRPRSASPAGAPWRWARRLPSAASSMSAYDTRSQAQQNTMKPDPTSSVDKITRVAAGDDRTVYDNFSVFLHWLTVLLVLSQFALAETWEWFARPTRHLMIVAHMSFGIILSAVIVVRIVWRLLPGHQVPPAVSGRVELASKAVHYLLYAMLAAEAVLGFVLRWAGDESMSFFGLLIPPPFAPFSKSAHHLVGELHELNGWAIIILAAGHAAAALYHHYVLRDRVLSRMLPSVRER